MRRKILTFVVIGTMALFMWVAMTACLTVLVEAWWTLFVVLLFHGQRITPFQSFVLAVTISTAAVIHRLVKS